MYPQVAAERYTIIKKSLQQNNANFAFDTSYIGDTIDNLKVHDMKLWKINFVKTCR